MSSVIDNLERAQLRRVPNFAPGDRVKVHFQVIEGERRRTQVFEGVVIARQGSGVRETFIVRKQSFGVGVERTFPVHSPKIEKIEVAARGDVRRAKLYYLRDRVGKGARVRERDYYGPEDEVAPGLIHAPAVAAEAPERDELEPEGEAAEPEIDATPEAQEADGSAQDSDDQQPEAEADEPQPEAEADEPQPEAEADEPQPETDSGEATPAAEEESEQPSDGSDESSGDSA